MSEKIISGIKLNVVLSSIGLKWKTKAKIIEEMRSKVDLMEDYTIEQIQELFENAKEKVKQW